MRSWLGACVQLITFTGGVQFTPPGPDISSQDLPEPQTPQPPSRAAEAMIDVERLTFGIVRCNMDCKIGFDEMEIVSDSS